MVPSPRSHLYRLVVVLIVAIGGLLYIKGLFVPKGWDYTHWYRSGALADLQKQPISYAGNAACASCHGKTLKDHVAILDAMAGSVHEHLSCESCHGPLNENDHLATVKIIRDNSLCLRCHDDVIGRPAKVGLFSQNFMAHQASGVTRSSNCTQCHDPHAPRRKVSLAAKAVPVPDSVQSIVAGCNGCHKPGTGTPLIAGQPREFLLNVMQEYRDGKRATEAMKGLFDDYDDTQINTLAQYYSSLNWDNVSERANPSLVKTGATINAHRCASCHGSDGRTGSGLTPRLAGQPASYIEDRLTAYLDPGASHPNQIMPMLVKGLSRHDVQALANFYAANPSAPRNLATELMTTAAGCDSCHRSGQPGMPYIDGQPEQYLRVVMLQYRDGSRSSTVMADLLHGFSNEKITALAKMYAATRWPGAKIRTNAALVKTGREIHDDKCAGCHGPGGIKADGMLPRLAGQEPSYIADQLRSYTNPRAKLPSEAMRTVARELSAADIRALAQYYASGADARAAPEAAAPAVPMVDVSDIVESCNTCHTAEDATDTPLIDGQPEAWLRTVLTQYHDEKRDSKVMVRTMKKYDAAQIASLAHHYAQKKWISANSATKPDLVEKGKALQAAKCDSCHANGGRKSSGDTPRIAGQPLEFLEQEMKNYQDENLKRPSSFMRKAVKSLSDEDISALANYYAGQGK